MTRMYDEILEAVKSFIKDNGGVDAVMGKELLPGSRPTLFRTTKKDKLPGPDLLCKWLEIIGSPPPPIVSLAPHGPTGAMSVIQPGGTIPEGLGSIVPVYQFAAGGLPVEWKEVEPFCEVCLPQKFMFPGLMVVQVIGDSMAPLIKDGAYVGINKHANTLTPGKVYAVNVPYEGLTIKRVFLDVDKGELLLRSENPIHPEQHIKIEDRDGLIVGEVIWGMQEI